VHAEGRHGLLRATGRRHTHGLSRHWGLGRHARVRAALFILTLNGLAYGLMSASAFLAAFAFPGHAQRFVCGAMWAHGAMGPIAIAAIFWPRMTYVGALWIVTFPAQVRYSRSSQDKLVVSPQVWLDRWQRQPKQCVSPVRL
jgi:hypothetical protein